jgi:ABC-type tungstate transport system permease subunit
LDLKIILEKSDDMKNTSSVIACDPNTITGLNTEGANAFIDWIFQDRTKQLISDYGVQEYNTNLFYILENS